MLLPCLQAPPVALRSVLEGEIRAFAAQQGVDGHRQCLRKFLELLLARGALCINGDLIDTLHCAASTARVQGIPQILTPSAGLAGLHAPSQLLCAGVLSQSQVLLAFGVVAELFNGVRDAEPLDGNPQSIILSGISLNLLGTAHTVPRI